MHVGVLLKQRWSHIHSLSSTVCFKGEVLLLLQKASWLVTFLTVCVQVRHVQVSIGNGETSLISSPLLSLHMLTLIRNELDGRESQRTSGRGEAALFRLP